MNVAARSPLVITDNRSFREHMAVLGYGDKVIGLLNIKPTEEVLFLDLVERGVILFPSALAQQLSRSKCLQAMIFKEWMVPHTFVARDRHDLVQGITFYGKQGVKSVVTKQNRLNCGLGIHIWSSIEDVYNQACFGSLGYPFVVQPFVESVTDVRVVIIGDYVEAYWRRNPYTLRNNLYFGGVSGEYRLTDEELSLCRRVMDRGKFPYAHIDLMISPAGVFLSEINLRGGLKGAKISTKEYHERIAALEMAFVDQGP
ncbi:MAG: ATP-grasp domain-containing protein [Dissulfurimicrobium sp.]|uniref:ATP-grasp domain-containing protein n=1 Tax=Dissulfurimicrobium TaxID=1769732 RepID=UPI003C71BE1A